MAGSLLSLLLNVAGIGGDNQPGAQPGIRAGFGRRHHPMGGFGLQPDRMRQVAALGAGVGALSALVKGVSAIRDSRALAGAVIASEKRAA